MFTDSEFIFARNISYILKIDIQTGNIIWNKQNLSQSIGSTSDGGIITSYPNGTGCEINKYDSSGDLVWTKVSQFPQMGFTAIKELSPNRYVAGGSWRYSSLYQSEYGYSPFLTCIDSIGNGLLDSTNFFFAGNANDNNLIRFYDDAVYIAAAMGSSGMPRDIKLQNGFGTSVYATNWAQSFQNNLNYKFSDHDGNGYIDTADIRKLSQSNITSTNVPSHWKRNSGNFTDPDLIFKARNNNLHIGDIMEVDIIIGSTTTPVDSIYGISFELNFYLLQAPYVFTAFDQPSISVYASEIGDTLNNLYYYYSYNGLSGKCNSVICRTDHVNAYLSGDTIATLHYPISTAYNTFDTLITNFSATAITVSGYPITLNYVNDAIYLSSTTGISALNNSSVSVFPSPTTNELNVILKNSNNPRFTIYNQTGQLIIQFNTQANELTLDVSSYKNGIYFLQVVDQETTTYSKFIVLKEKM